MGSTCLHDLIYFPKQQASHQLAVSSTNTKLMLAETFQDLCELFMNITPNLFRTDIETNSHGNAIFYCNTLLCAYLIECLVARHKPLLDSLSPSVPELQHLGSQTFVNQLKFQENFILFFLRNETFRVSLQTIAEEIPSTDLKVSAKSHYNFRQCLNNSLKNLFALHKAFDGVLPQKIYVKTFTTLINSLLTEFTSAILALEDISSLAASHLSHELDYLSKELKMYVEHSQQITAKWLKLNEINFVLKVSLTIILHPTRFALITLLSFSIVPLSVFLSFPLLYYFYFVSLLRSFPAVINININNIIIIIMVVDNIMSSLHYLRLLIVGLMVKDCWRII